MNPVFAQQETPLGEIIGIGPLGEFAVSESEAVNLITQIIRNIIGLMTIVAGIWFIFQFIIGGISWLTAGGDKAKTEAARAKITSGIIGLAIVIAAVFIIDLIGRLLGLEILQPGQYILEMWSS